MRSQTGRVGKVYSIASTREEPEPVDPPHPPSTVGEAPVDRLLTVADVAERLGTTERFPRRLIAEARIDYVKFGESRNAPVRIPESALRRFIDDSTIRAGA